MLYRIFIWLFSLTIKGYFRSIYVKGMEQIPESCPKIFVANHNSAFMDPILLAVHIKQPLYFLARGESFKSNIISKFFRFLHMIPIYKPEISPDEVHKNKMIFQKCFNHLKGGKSILIFPEGVSKTERNLRKIKTGTARIALGAESQNNFSLNTKIVPVGINYSNPHFFRSDVFIYFGKPIALKNYAKEYQLNMTETVTKVTDDIRVSLEELVVIVKDEKLDRLIRQIEILYRSELRVRNKHEHKAAQDFYLSQEIVKAVEYYKKIKPEKMQAFEEKINKYLKTLKQLKIRDTQIRSSKIKLKLFSKTLYFIFGFPFFLYGYLVNIIPFRAADYLSKKITVRKDFIGSMKIAFGMFVFLIFYVLEIIVFTSFIHWYWWIVFTLSLYPLGLFTVNYIKNYYLFRGNFRYIYLFIRKSHLITELQITRKEIIEELEEGRQLYLNSKD
jgi:glycerol-3-phosphate O-acyltransferase/dihydroxyacetone phosphate acyltransferase